MADVIAIASFTMKDYLGKKASAPYYIACVDTSTIASLITACSTLGSLVAPLTAGAIVSMQVSFDLTPTDSWNTDKPVSGVPVNVIGGFDFDQYGDPYAFAEIVPAFNPADWTSGPLPIPDKTNEDVIAYVTGLTSSNGLGTGFSAISKFDNSLTDLRDTFQGNRKYKRQSRRQLTR